MKYSLKTIQKNLEESKHRLLQVKTYGDKVISKHDLRNGYNADFYLNKIPVLENSVKYWENKLNLIKGNQLNLFL